MINPINNYVNKNIYVNTISNESLNPKYVGCYNDDSYKPLMTFIDGIPPKNYIQNGNFSKPDIGNNKYQFISSNNKVPGWYFYCYFVNNCSEINVYRPYPSGKQCVLFRSEQNIVQPNLRLNSGTYNLSFYSTGWIGSPLNPIKINLNNSKKKQVFTTFITPTSNSNWNKTNITININTNDVYTLSLSGTRGDGWVAIQDILLSESGKSVKPPLFTYETCKNTAIMSGNQYFAIQNFNDSTQTGYCAIGNNKLTATRLGESTTISGGKVIWSTNTKGTGNTVALTSLGQLFVYDSSSYPLFQTTSNTTSKSTIQSTNYIGCYGDRSQRAMPLYKGGLRAYNYDSCEQLAKENNYNYFGLQHSTYDGSRAQCGLSNDIKHSTKYGKATNCFKIKNGIVVGSGWSNAIYNLNSPDSFYYLILQDDGNMVIYRGNDPNDNQGMIWSSETSSKKQEPNNNYVASKGKFGKNWISSGSTMSSGDWIGSNDGSIYLLMQEDGNLTLNATAIVGSCKTINNETVGGPLSNAIYDLGLVGYPKNVGKMAYINENNKKLEYPSYMLSYLGSDLPSEYTKMDMYNSYGTDIQRLNKTTEDNCKVICDNTKDCAGFVFDTPSKSCVLKRDNIFPKGKLINDKNKNLFFKKPNISKLPEGITDKIMNVDSIFYQKFSSAGTMYPKYNINQKRTMSVSQKQYLDQLEGRLLLLGKQIVEIDEILKTKNLNAYQQNLLNNQNIEKNIYDNYNVNDIIDYKESTDINNITNVLKDTDIIVLQKNTSFLFWSILTVGIVLISINIINRN